MNSATEAVTPAVLALIGRELVRRGECVFAIKMIDGELRLIPAGSWDIRGGWDESGWLYRVDLFGASEHETELIPSTGVVHLRYAVDPGNPWIGLAPLQWARLTGQLTANLETRLSEEAGAPVGSFMPVPDGQDGGDAEDADADSLAMLKGDVRAAKGRMVLVETTAAGWGGGRSGAPMADWKPSRFGFDAPATSIAAHSAASLMVLNACGVPVSLATDADGTSQREAWRRFVHGAIAPTGKMVAAELSRKLDTPGLSFDFSSLYASDLAGRAASFQKLIAGGMDTDKALAIAGLMADEM